MPKLLLMAPCDNVLVNKGTESVSLIVIFTAIQIPELPPGIPENSAAPMRWSLFSDWEIAEEDRGKTFEQVVTFREELTGRAVLEFIIEFEASASNVHQRTSAQFGFMPILNAVRHRFISGIREKGSSDYEEVGSYPVEVVHGATPDPS